MKKIGNVSIHDKTTINDGNYSDGDIEKEILEIVKHNIDFQETISSDHRWPILYHLSDVRGNLVRWLDFDSNSKLLEIGAGCGALTSTFCELAGSVTAVELSSRRAEIIAYRNKQRTNLEVVIANIGNLSYKEEFDIVTLIGVVEYSGMFFKDSSEPYKSCVKKAYDSLKKGGFLILAIENKFGLKYWNGSREDHTGNYFEGIENYPVDKGIRTFSKAELEVLLNELGFSSLRFYYPFPDYKLPHQIYSDYMLPSTGELHPEESNYDRDRLELFNERKVIEAMIEENMFSFFSNSFLIIAQK